MPLSAPAHNFVKIVLNGQEKPLAAPMTIAALLQEMGFSERRVAVEVTRKIVPRSQHGDFQLQDNDRVEVVFAIGGGGMSSAQDARRARSRGPTKWGCDREAGCGAPRSWRSSLSPPLPDPAGAGPSGYAPASTREAGMQASANTAGRRRHRVLVWFGLTEAAGMSRVLRWRT